MRPDYISQDKCTIRFFNCDNVLFMQDIPDKFYDLAIVDPPYGIDFVSKGKIGNSKFKAKKWDQSIPYNSYFTELLRISKNQIIWGANYFNFIWRYFNKGFIYWNKLNHDNKGDGELALTSFDIGNRYFEYMWDGNRYGVLNNIKGVGKPTIRIHPTEKPIQLYRWLLQNYAKPGQKIIDTHGGSFSHAIACDMEGFDLDIVELDKEYFDQALNRFKIYKSQLICNFL